MLGHTPSRDIYSAASTVDGRLDELISCQRIRRNNYKLNTKFSKHVFSANRELQLLSRCRFQQVPIRPTDSDSVIRILLAMLHHFSGPVPKLFLRRHISNI